MGAVVTNHLQKLRVGFRNFFPLCKPRVSAMIVFTAVIGMFLATRDLCHSAF